MTKPDNYKDKNRKSQHPAKRISVEEHFSCPEHVEYLRAILDKEYPSAEVIAQEKYILSDAPFLHALQSPEVRHMLERLYDMDTLRIGEMKSSGIDRQIVSLVSPGIQVFEPDVAVRLAKKYNDVLSSLVKEHPERFTGLASAAPQVPEAAADELERCVKDLNFRGAVINSHTKGEYLDQKKYRVIFERAQQLNVPVYIHPRSPSPDMIKPYLGYPMLDSAMLGFGAETSLHAMRLICSGLFDEYPRLKIILGHLGEGLPGYLQRIDNRWTIAPFQKSLVKLPGQYFKENFAVTTSGVFSRPALEMTLSILGAESIMFAVDYPMEKPEEAIAFLEGSEIDPADKEKIFHLNAEKIFSV